MRTINRYLVSCFVCVGCAFATSLLLVLNQIEFDTALALCVGIILLAPALLETITDTGVGINLSISNMPGLYGCFYVSYYVVALVLFGLRADVQKDNIIEISVLILLGYIGWRAGMALSGAGKGKLRAPVFGHRETGSLLILCWLGFGLVMVGYGYKASVGAFYTHGVSFEQEPTLAASILQNVTFPFEFPVIILLALLSAGGIMQKKAKISLWILAGIMCVAHLLASEFRWIVTDLVLIVATLQFAAGFRLTWRRIAAGLCLFIPILLVIQATRIDAETRMATGGAMESVSLLVNGIVAATDRSTGTQATTRTSERASNALLFLSTLIDRVGAGSPYLYGKVMGNQLTAMVPRAVWQDKPTYTSTQRLIRLEFGLPDTDDSPGPLISYYAFGGALAVFVLLFLFGLFLGILQRWAARGNGLLPWMVLIWVLSAAVQVECDQVMGVVGSLRHCVVAYIVLCLILLVYPSKGVACLQVRGSGHPSSGAA